MMTNQEILEKSIQKAIDGGWQAADWVQGPAHLASAAISQNWVEHVIFNHAFAKALWGEETSGTSVDKEYDETGSKVVRQFTVTNVAPWQHHLMRMVIAEDPIKYLEANL